MNGLSLKIKKIKSIINSATEALSHREINLKNLSSLCASVSL